MLFFALAKFNSGRPIAQTVGFYCWNWEAVPFYNSSMKQAVFMWHVLSSVVIRWKLEPFRPIVFGVSGGSLDVLWYFSYDTIINTSADDTRFTFLYIMPSWLFWWLVWMKFIRNKTNWLIDWLINKNSEAHEKTVLYNMTIMEVKSHRLLTRYPSWETAPSNETPGKQH